jgi:hypothetical protein
MFTPSGRPGSPAARLVRLIMPTLLMLEALLTARWIAALIPSLPTRGLSTDLLIALRGLVGSAQLVAAVTLRWRRPFAARLAVACLAASAGLIVFETGLRLAPSNLDPSFKWWAVLAYLSYAVVASWAISGTNE